MDTTMGPAPTAASGAVGCPASAHGAPIMSASPAAGEASLGRHLARRLVQVGVGDVFAVPGDFNLTLLDHLIAEPGLRLVGCCNELNAGYAADGYARARGVGACAVTFTVGGLSVLNAIAGAYGENLPVICIAGGPNSNDYGTNRILHHTIQTVTCHQAVVTNLDDAHEQIDTAVATALRESKLVYLSISCNLPGLRASPTGRPFASAWTENTPTPCSSGATRSVRAVRGDANAAQICGTFASPRTLRGRAERPLASPTGPPGSDPDSSRCELKQNNCRGGQPPEWQPRRSTREPSEWSAEPPRKSNRRPLRYTRCH